MSKQLFPLGILALLCSLGIRTLPWSRTTHDQRQLEIEWSNSHLGRLLPDVWVTKDGGDKLPLRDLTRGHWSFVVLASGIVPDALVYPEVLCDQYARQHLRYIFILPASAKISDDDREYLTNPRLEIVYDADGSLPGRLKVRGEQYVASFFVNPVPRLSTHDRSQCRS